MTFKHPQLPNRRLSDKLRDAFYAAYDEGAVEIAEKLLGQLEKLIHRPLVLPTGVNRRQPENLDALFKRLSNLLPMPRASILPRKARHFPDEFGMTPQMERGLDRSTVYQTDGPSAFHAQGWLAGYLHRGIALCPYKYTTMAYRRWMQGYILGAQMRRRIAQEAGRRTAT